MNGHFLDDSVAVFLFGTVCVGIDLLLGDLLSDYFNLHCDVLPSYKAIYTMYLEGQSCAEISQKLSELGVVGRNGGAITASGVNYILRNETYTGDKRLLKSGRKDLFTGAKSSRESILLENDHEAIIDRDTWEKVQTRLDSKGMLGRKNIQRGGGRMHFLHDKLICGCCGEFMTRRTLRAYSKPGTEPVRFKVWECYGKPKGKKGNGCKMRTVKEDVLFRAIEEATGKAVDEQSAAAIKRVIVTEDDIVVEKA